MPSPRTGLLLLLLSLFGSQQVAAENMPKFLAVVDPPEALVRQVRTVSEVVREGRHISVIEAPTVLSRNLLDQVAGEIVIGFEVFPLVHLQQERS